MTVDCNWCTLKVDNECMHALMCLHTNHGEGDLVITEQEIYDFLDDQNITYGISSVAVSSMVAHATYEQYICVAQGTPALRGNDAYYEYQKDMQDMKKKPLINEDGTADYKNSLSLATINEGELLAVYIPPTEGSCGYDIYGRFLPSLGNGKDVLPLRGRGIIADDEKKNFYAEYTGHIVMDGKNIFIDKLYRVNGDLDIEVGNIHFDGDVEVSGDVRSGFGIYAKGSIFIHGHVGACILNAGQNITIEKGIQGRSICKISAGGDIACKFIESCYIKAGGNIYGDSVLGSTLIAENQVIITSRHGNVINSEVYGMAGVIVREAGNSAGVSTLLRAGLPREYYARAAELTSEIEKTDEKTAQFNHHLETLEKQVNDPNDPKLVSTRMQIIRAKIVLDSSRTEYMEELTSLNERIETDIQNSFINVTGTVNEGVKIYIGTFPYLVNEPVKEVTFRISNNSVIMRPLE